MLHKDFNESEEEEDEEENTLKAILPIPIPIVASMAVGFRSQSASATSKRKLMTGSQQQPADALVSVDDPDDFTPVQNTRLHPERTIRISSWKKYCSSDTAPIPSAGTAAASTQTGNSKWASKFMIFRRTVFENRPPNSKSPTTVLSCLTMNQQQHSLKRKPNNDNIKNGTIEVPDTNAALGPYPNGKRRAQSVTGAEHSGLDLKWLSQTEMVQQQYQEQHAQQHGGHEQQYLGKSATLRKNGVVIRVPFKFVSESQKEEAEERILQTRYMSMQRNLIEESKSNQQVNRRYAALNESLQQQSNQSYHCYSHHNPLQQQSQYLHQQSSLTASVPRKNANPYSSTIKFVFTSLNFQQSNQVGSPTNFQEVGRSSSLSRGSNHTATSRKSQANPTTTAGPTTSTTMNTLASSMANDFVGFSNPLLSKYIGITKDSVRLNPKQSLVHHQNQREVFQIPINRLGQKPPNSLKSVDGLHYRCRQTQQSNGTQNIQCSSNGTPLARTARDISASRGGSRRPSPSPTSTYKRNFAAPLNQLVM